ncbi:MAG: chloride channel protein [Anaerolineales bacterium]|nr:chloride channel protein [Anaerolineales bacterium]
MSSDQVKLPQAGSGIFTESFERLKSGVNFNNFATLIVVAVVMGAGTGLITVIFVKAIAWVRHISFEEGLPQLLAPLGVGWIILVPVIGSLITGPMIAFWAIEAKGHGVPEVMQAIIMRRGRIRPRVALVKSVASAICIGTGGSAGREGPIVQVGAALGSTAAQLLGLGPQRTITLVACGAAAGISATFNAPIAGVIFAMEVILGEFTTHYFGMVVIAAVAASIVSREFLGDNPAFAIPSYALVSAWELPMYALLGVLAALVGRGFVKILYYFEDLFDDWRFPTAFKPAVGAIGVGLIGVLYPQALGAGLTTIEQGLNGSLPWTLLLVLVFAKLMATTFTLGSGNSGGIFSPSLYMGAMLGGVFGVGVHALFPTVTASSGAYALVGMASVFSAAAHAPLTAFLIVFEMSGDYRMILPLMVTVGLSTLLSQTMSPLSIYTLKLANKGIPLERDRDVDVMKGITVGEAMTQKPDIVRAEMSLPQLADRFVETRHHGFPVLDKDEQLLGVVTIKDLEQAPDHVNEQPPLVADITHQEIVVAYPGDPLSKALRYMSDRGFGRIPVVDPQQPKRLVGLLRRVDVVRAYRRAILRKMENQYATENLRLGRLTETEILEFILTSNMAAVGQQIMDLDLPPQALITSVQRNNQIIIAHGQTRLQPSDRVVVITRQGTADAVRQAIVGHS